MNPEKHINVDLVEILEIIQIIDNTEKKDIYNIALLEVKYNITHKNMIKITG